ncbi:MAG: DUF2878 domain-containing protein [Xanthomonadales bacterium]|nr:DUF2878 domain-containing protein [Xanthomonadales bacterium]
MSAWTRKVLLNVIALQVGWFACVLGAANDLPWLGLPVVVGVLLLHMHLVDDIRPEMRLVGLSILIGATFDSLLMASGWIDYRNGFILTGLAPAWILAMWAQFATTLNLSMAWLKGRPVVASIAGLIFGPLSWYTGAKLGAIELVNPVAALTALAIGWSLVMPLLAIAAQRYNGVFETPQLAADEGLAG